MCAYIRLTSLEVKILWQLLEHFAYIQTEHMKIGIVKFAIGVPTYLHIFHKSY